jgi:hypothetical protein
MLGAATILIEEVRKWRSDTESGPTPQELLTAIETLRANAYALYPEIRELFDVAVDSWWAPTWGPKPTSEQLVPALDASIAGAPFDRPYSGNDGDRELLRLYTGTLTTRYVQGLEDYPGHWVDAVKLTEQGLVVEDRAKREVAILKALTRIYVHKDSTLGAQQEGERRIIEHLFNSYLASIQKPGGGDIFPRRVVEDARKMANEGGPKAKMVRFVVDVIAAMTEAQAIAAYERLLGNDFGSLTEGALL